MVEIPGSGWVALVSRQERKAPPAEAPGGRREKSCASIRPQLDETQFLLHVEFHFLAMTRKLLIVDDNKSVRDSLRFLLERRGYATVVAAGGPEAIALAGQQVFDGALVDIHMPGMNGMAVCRALQAQAAEAGRKIALWMMTGACTPEITKASIDAGALMLLAKPFDYEDLYRRFEEQFGESPPAPAEPDDPL